MDAIFPSFLDQYAGLLFFIIVHVVSGSIENWHVKIYSAI